LFNKFIQLNCNIIMQLIIEKTLFFPIVACFIFFFHSLAVKNYPFFVLNLGTNAGYYPTYYDYYRCNNPYVTIAAIFPNVDGNDRVASWRNVIVGTVFELIKARITRRFGLYARNVVCGFPH